MVNAKNSIDNGKLIIIKTYKDKLNRNETVTQHEKFG